MCLDGFVRLWEAQFIVFCVSGRLWEGHSVVFHEVLRLLGSQVSNGFMGRVVWGALRRL